MILNEISELRGQIKALTFDVFGTVVDWRSSVQDELSAAAKRKLESTVADSLPEATRRCLEKIGDDDWARFAQEWRDTYKVFCKSFVPGVTEWKDIDTHHYDSLVHLLRKWQLGDLYTDDEVRSLSLAWHRLRPWADSSEGIRKLGGGVVTATLSNGNQELLRDLNSNGNLGFQKLISAADFGAYKPNPQVYLGAVSALGVEAGEVGMVAAHLGDLQAARACGMRTIYVDRPGEEDWKSTEERYERAKEWVDIWVAQGQGGFLEVCRQLGIS